jgi:hypothetical protein
MLNQVQHDLGNTQSFTLRQAQGDNYDLDNLILCRTYFCHGEPVEPSLTPFDSSDNYRDRATIILENNFFINPSNSLFQRENCIALFSRLRKIYHRLLTLLIICWTDTKNGEG